MFLSSKEKETRFAQVRREMAKQGIDALIARGSSAVRGDGAAFRFLTDFPNVNIPLVLVFFRDAERGTYSTRRIPFPGDASRKKFLGKRHPAQHEFL
jgi:hypothetical protein